MEKLFENFSKNSRTQRERESVSRVLLLYAVTILHNMLAMLFSKTFSKLRERQKERERTRCCRVRNVKVHCFIEENVEKLFGRADAKLSNSLLVEKIRRFFEMSQKQQSRRCCKRWRCCLARADCIRFYSEFRKKNRGRFSNRRIVVAPSLAVRALCLLSGLCGGFTFERLVQYSRKSAM